ncbi:hypothetical protein OEZ86_006464 [Tetradesmus obliquus]|nr:hypothetical protein OEZ86_006464 [Tetradesmus obliquus]
MSGLTELNLSGNCLCLPDSSFGVFRRHFCPGLADMASLVKLDLSGCRFPYKLLRLLVSGLPGSVSDVILDGCVDVTAGDLQALALLPGLRRLSVNDTQPALRDKHAEVLAGMAGLRQLLLAGNELGPKGLALLLQGLPQLLLLDVRGNVKLKKGGAVAAAACQHSGYCQVLVVHGYEGVGLAAGLEPGMEPSASEFYSQVM